MLNEIEKNLNCNEKKLFLNGLKRNEVNWTEMIKIWFKKWTELWKLVKNYYSKIKIWNVCSKNKVKIEMLNKKNYTKKTNEILIIKTRIC